MSEVPLYLGQEGGREAVARKGDSAPLVDLEHVDRLGVEHQPVFKAHRRGSEEGSYLRLIDMARI